MKIKIKKARSAAAVLICLAAVMILNVAVFGDEPDENAARDDPDAGNITVMEKTEEEDYERTGLMPVCVLTGSGVNVAILPEKVFYSCENLKFTIQKPDDLPEGEVTGSETYCVLSRGADSGSEEKIQMDGDDFTLSPSNDKEEYYVSFIRRLDIENTTEITEETENVENTGNTENKENPGNNGNTGNAEDFENNENPENTGNNEFTEDTIKTVTKHIYHAVYSSKTYHVIFDLSDPVISDGSGIDWSEWFNADKNVTFTFKDEGSGIARASVMSGGGVLYEYHFNNDEERCDELSADIMLNEEASDESGRRITVSLEDRAGNISEQSYTYYLDKTAPELTYSGPAGGSINKTDCALKFTAHDTIMSTAYIEYSITAVKRGAAIPVVLKKAEEADGILSAEELLSADADYIVTASAFDKAGNRSVETAVNFRIDRTAPETAIGGFENGADYRCDVYARFTAKEEFYKDAEGSIKVIRKWPGGSEVYSEENFTFSAEEYLRNMALGDDGDYDITLYVRDAAGNISESVSSVRVDKNAPEVSIKSLQDKAVTSSAPGFLIGVSEKFYDSGTAKVTLYEKDDNGLLKEEQSAVYFMPEENMTIPFTVEKEGSYILSVSAYDRAGNESLKSVEFAYDCTCPQIGWLETINRKYLKSFSFPKFFSKNIKDRSAATYKAYINAGTLNEGDVITGDGKYVIRIIATDEAGNVSEETAEFIVDNTSPRIIAKGIGSNGKVRSGSRITFSLYDKEDRFEKCVYNGKPLTVADDCRECSIDITEDGEHEISLLAKDEAGNVTEKMFVVSASAFTMPPRVESAVRTLVKSGTENNTQNDSEKVDKIPIEKSAIILIPVFMGILGLGVWKIKKNTGFRDN